MKNQTRSMNADFAQGHIDSSYIMLCPNRGGVIEHPPVERLSWPTYQNAELYSESPFIEAHIARAGLPREVRSHAG